MLSNAYFLAKFRFDTAENQPAKNLQNFSKFANFANFANPNRDRMPQVLYHMTTRAEWEAAKAEVAEALGAAKAEADQKIAGA